MTGFMSWLRNPRVVLGAGLAGALTLGGLWLATAADRGPAPTEIAAGQSGTAAGVEWRLRELSAVHSVASGSSRSEPVRGAVFVLARFDYRAEPGQELYCRTSLVGDGRQWTADLHSPADPGFSAGCDGRPEGTAEVVFEIPADAVGEVRGLDVSAAGGTVRLAGDVQ